MVVAVMRGGWRLVAWLAAGLAAVGFVALVSVACWLGGDELAKRRGAAKAGKS